MLITQDQPEIINRCDKRTCEGLKTSALQSLTYSDSWNETNTRSRTKTGLSSPWNGSDRFHLHRGKNNSTSLQAIKQSSNPTVRWWRQKERQISNTTTLHEHQTFWCIFFAATTTGTWNVILGPFIRGKIRRVLNYTRTFRINSTFRLK